MNVKQVIVIRKDLKMRRGKEIAQGSHASQAWLLARLKQQIDKGSALMEDDFTEAETHWMENGHAKVTLQVADEKELHEIYRAARDARLLVYLITDAGLTEFNGIPTKTCLAIGPDESEKIDPITGNLKLY